MKNSLTLSLCLLIALPLWAQKNQRSLVREQNSGKIPVPGAQVV
jgi:hypothetical protein